MDRHALRRRLVAGCALVGLAAFWAAPVTAQEAGAPAGPAADSTEQRGSSDVTTDIIVTAEKRAANVQDVPSSVSVIGGEALENLRVTQLADIAAYVPGLQIVSNGTPGQTTISLRGIAPVSDSATVGTYIDDTPIGGSSLLSRANQYQLDLLPYDVERIEVLRGPQGTLYGASTLGGLLKYVLVKPSLDRVGLRAGAELFGIRSGDDLGWGAQAQINAPLITDKVGLLASYARRDTPGYIDNARSGERDQNNLRQESARFALLLQPSDRFSIQLGALFQRVDADGDATIAIDPTTRRRAGDGLSNTNFIDQTFDSKVDYFSATVTGDRDWAVLTSATSYSNSRVDRVRDSTLVYGVLFPAFDPRLPAGLSPFTLNLRTKKITQEVRLSSPSGGRLEWLVGGFYTHEKSSNRQELGALLPNGSPIPGLDPLATVIIPSTYDEIAGFANVTLNLSEAFRISGGLRHARNEQSFTDIISGVIVPPATTRGKSSEDVLTYSVSPEFHPSEDVMLYGRVATGYQPGGPNGALPGVPPSVDSSTLINYEVGVKSQFWNRRILLNVTAFQLDWKDIQVAAIVNNNGYTTNGGRARSRGFEAEATIRPARGLSLGGTVAYTDARLREDVPSISGLRGDRLPNVPRWSGSLQAGYEWNLSDAVSAQFGGLLRVLGDRFSRVPSDPLALRTPGFATADLNASISYDRFTLRAYARNVGDRRAILNQDVIPNGLTGQPSLISAAVLQPRTVGVALETRF